MTTHRLPRNYGPQARDRRVHLGPGRWPGIRQNDGSPDFLLVWRVNPPPLRTGRRIGRALSRLRSWRVHIRAIRHVLRLRVALLSQLCCLSNKFFKSELTIDNREAVFQYSSGRRSGTLRPYPAWGSLCAWTVVGAG